MDPFQYENLFYDPLHGYIPFVSQGRQSGESTERQLIDSPWVQRLRQIHQLQTAWWVFPTAEHTRFQHVLGAMHLASRSVGRWYRSLKQSVADVPSLPYVDLLMRTAALLHDVGHGPFGHFFDAHFLCHYQLTHESLGTHIIEGPLAGLLGDLRQTPAGRIGADERLEPGQISYLICRPRDRDSGTSAPRWLQLLRSLFCGIYTVDNMDFVLRDAYMTGYSPRAFDLERLLHYTFFTQDGLTIHSRGMDALMRFLSARAELFRSVYYHRTVRAIDLELADLFADGRQYLFPHNPVEALDAYCRLTEWSLLVDVGRWCHSDDERKRELGERWQRLMAREVPWKMVCQRTVVFAAGQSEAASLLSSPQLLEKQLRTFLPRELAELPLRVDIARQIHRPHTRGPAAGHNFLYDADRRRVRPLDAHELYRQLPISHRICRVYAHDVGAGEQITAALDRILGDAVEDDLTNM